MATAASRPEQPPGGGPPVPPDPGGRDESALSRLARAIAPGSLGEIGLAIPWHHRLSTKLVALVGLVALATVAAFFLAEIRVQRHLLAQAVAESDLLSHTIRNALHRAMLQDRRADAYLIMHDIGRETGIEMVRMMDGEGRITFSTDRSEIGKAVDRRAEACIACHAEGEPLHKLDLADRSRVFRNGPHRLLGIVTPIYNEGSCATAACHAHPAARKVLGVLDIGVSLQRLDREMAAFRLRNLVVAAIAAAALALVVFVFTRRHLIRPVAALVQATRRVARDQLELEVPVTWSGELGILATSFNDMTRSLRTTKKELDSLMHGLERQVEERTAALRMAQDQLVRTEKLTSLGKLSASIAHEINNPLAGIVTFAKLMIRTIEHGPVGEAERKTMVKQLELVYRESQRCTAIVRNLLDFARERPLQLKDVDVGAAVEEMLTLVANQAAIQGIEIVKELAPLPPVQADFGQLRQAFVNVAMNAIEAMPAGGRLVVAARQLPQAGTVEVSFADTGRGIAPEIMQRIFDPFFTTKEKGTGLGLSVVYGIVDRHKGQVSVDSQPGKGTRFVVSLPAAPR
jgi:two-component system NtrC family sensor kinase